MRKRQREGAREGDRLGSGGSRRWRCCWWGRGEDIEAMATEGGGRGADGEDEGGREEERGEGVVWRFTIRVYL